MTKDHVAIAQERIAKAQQQADDTRAVIASVGTELSSRARYLYDRSDYQGTIGGLGYELPMLEIPALLDRLPPVPLEYRKDANWAGHVWPVSRPVTARDHLVERNLASPFYITVMQYNHDWKPQAKVEWYTPCQGSDLLIGVHAELTDPRAWVICKADAHRDEWDRITHYTYYATPKWHGAHVSKASSGGMRNELHHPWYTYWWDPGHTLAEVLQP